MNISRESIVAACKSALEALPAVEAAFIGGSASFDRLDEWSDIDLCCVGPQSEFAAVYDALESGLESCSPIALKLEMPPSAIWPGLSQRFYRLRDTDEFLMIDFCQLTPEQLVTFMEPQRHGTPIVLFDRTGIIKPVPLEADHHKRLKNRIEWLRKSFPMFQNLVRKAVLRGDLIEAKAVWMSHSMRPLVDALRARHNPERFDYGFRYTLHDLPHKVAKELEALMWPKDAEDLLSKLDVAAELFNDTIEALSADL